MKKQNFLSTKNLVLIAMFGALSAVLAFFQISVPFAPPFYKIDFCEVPAFIGAFAMGPAAGALIEVVKVALTVITRGTTTMYVGEAANLIGSIIFIVPAAMIYKRNKTRKNAIFALMISVVIMVVSAAAINVFITLPFYAKVAFDGIDNIIAMGTGVNANITNLFTFVVFAIVPFNILKGIIISAITALIYKRVSIVIRMADSPAKITKKGVKKA